MHPQKVTVFSKSHPKPMRQ